MEEQDQDNGESIMNSNESLAETFSPEKMQELTSDAIDWTVTFVPKLLIAILILWIGFKVVNKLSTLLGKGLGKADLGLEITGFLQSILTTIMKIVVIGVAASVIGVKMTALVGLLGAAVFAIGMAMQGFMGNFASGLTILFLKPYKVNDLVSIDDKFGKVQNIQIFNTTLLTPGDKTLIIPNGQVTDNVITNYSTHGNIRLELNVSMPYAESFPKVKEVILNALKQSEYVKWEKEPLIGIETYDSHNIQLAIRPIVDPNDYWEATFEIYGLIKKEFNASDIKAAYSEGVELGPIGA